MAIKKKAPQPQKLIERIPTGIPGLDDMLQGGFVKDSTVLVQGGTGSGKTLMCLQYLYNGAVQYNEAGIYLSFAESDDMVYQHGKMFNWDFKRLAASNKFAIIRYQPHEIVKIIEEGGGVIRDTVESMGAKRLVIDSLSAYEMMFENKYRANESILALFEILRKWSTTSLVTSETMISPLKAGRGRLGFLTDGIINLYYLRTARHRSRVVEILKMRDTHHSDELHVFELTPHGLKVSRRLGKIERS